MTYIEKIRERLGKVTKGEWEWIRWPAESMEQALDWIKKSIEKGEGFRLHGVGGHDPDEVTICLTGNGPKSEANAVFITCAPTDLAALLEVVDAAMEEDRGEYGPKLRKALDKLNGARS
jgi:hypothetical protein